MVFNIRMHMCALKDKNKPYLIKFFYVSDGWKRGKANIKYWQFGNGNLTPNN